MTIDLTQGANTLISNTAHDRLIIQLTWQAPPAYELDASAFLLTTQRQVLNDAGMVFFNQPISADHAVQYQPEQHLFNIALTKLNPAVTKIAFTLTLYQGMQRHQSFKHITQATLQVRINSQIIARYVVSNTTLQQETALIIAELYLNKGQWKLRAIGQGFHGGLAAMCQYYGVTVAEDESAQPPVMNRNDLILLEKKLRHAPTLLAFAKQARVSLEKNHLSTQQARVAICLAISTAMAKLYSNGRIQQLSEKILALACQWQETVTVEVFLCNDKAHHLPALHLHNFDGFCQLLPNHAPLDKPICYGKVMKMLRNFYFPTEINPHKPLITQAHSPVYVVFITDSNTDDSEETRRQLKGSSYEPIFWQFMVIGKTTKSIKNKSFISKSFASDFSFLESLDNLAARYLNNIDFFSVEDPEELSDAELYDALTVAYSLWLKSAREKQMLRF